jgi:hypothetical protein
MCLKPKKAFILVISCLFMQEERYLYESSPLLQSPPGGFGAMRTDQQILLRKEEENIGAANVLIDQGYYDIAVLVSAWH